MTRRRKDDDDDTEVECKGFWFQCVDGVGFDVSVQFPLIDLC
jgi:hypothetical protein